MSATSTLLRLGAFAIAGMAHLAALLWAVDQIAPETASAEVASDMVSAVSFAALASVAVAVSPSTVEAQEPVQAEQAVEALSPVSPVIDSAPAASSAPVVPADSVAPDVPLVENGLAMSMRPLTRPASVQERASALAAERRAAAEARRAAQARSATTEQRRTSPAQSRSASAPSSRAVQPSRPAAPSRADFSRYDGAVAARINRVWQRQRAPRQGAVRVAFTISGNGQLAAVSVSRSSGNARLDRVAVQTVRRAAPFGAPPGGQRRNATITLRAQ